MLLDIKAEEVKVLSAPNYEGLTIEDFLETASKHQEIEPYLPEERDLHRLPRSFIINLMYTILGEPIKNYVKYIVEKRNSAVIDKQNMGLELDDEIQRAFERSTYVSCKSKTRHLLRSPPSRPGAGSRPKRPVADQEFV